MIYSTTEIGIGVMAVSAMLILLAVSVLLHDWIIDTHPNTPD